MLHDNHVSAPIGFVFERGRQEANLEEAKQSVGQSEQVRVRGEHRGEGQQRGEKIEDKSSGSCQKAGADLVEREQACGEPREDAEPQALMRWFLGDDGQETLPPGSKLPVRPQGLAEEHRTKKNKKLLLLTTTYYYYY